MLGGCFRRFSLNVRGAAPGSGHQDFHTDWGKNPGALMTPPVYQITNSIWMLDEFTTSNGATRILPTSHKSGEGGQPPASLTNAAASQRGEVLCTGPQGSVVVFSSHCFHGGTLNTTEITRMAVHSAFVRRSVTNCEGHSYEQQNPLSPAVLDRLCETAHGRAVVTVLDVTNPSLCVDTVVDKKSSKL
jgi:ectoine hydroxylase-related dioxygenase (phytanoyl-CoA dioxygenase family)